MTEDQKFLSEVKARANMATQALASKSFSDFRKEMERVQAIADLERHSRTDIPRLIAIVEARDEELSDTRQLYYQVIEDRNSFEREWRRARKQLDVARVALEVIASAYNNGGTAAKALVEIDRLERS